MIIPLSLFIFNRITFSNRETDVIRLWTRYLKKWLSQLIATFSMTILIQFLSIVWKTHETIFSGLYIIRKMPCGHIDNSLLSRSIYVQYEKWNKIFHFLNLNLLNNFSIQCLIDDKIQRYKKEKTWSNHFINFWNSRNQIWKWGKL